MVVQPNHQGQNNYPVVGRLNKRLLAAVVGAAATRS
jgi:hypothetical protein